MAIDEYYELDIYAPVAFAAAPKHNRINNHHLWVIPDTGAYCVLSEVDHAMLLGLVDGLTPAEVLEFMLINHHIGRSIEDMRKYVHAFFDSLAISGFIDGINGRHKLAKPLIPEKYARFHLTHACQLKCIHCYMESSPTINRSGELSTGRWKSLIEEFALGGGKEILFSGGEPLLRDDCCDLFEHAKANGLGVFILTNGLLIHKYADRLQKCVGAMQISMGSPEEESNDAIRGRGTYKQIISALDLVSSRKFVESGIEIVVNITAMESNINAITLNMIPLMDTYRPAGIQFNISASVMPYGRGCQFEESSSTEKTNEKRIQLSDIMNNISKPQTHFGTENKDHCGYGGKFVVNPYGQVYPCHLEEKALGHIDDKSIKDWCSELRCHGSEHTVDKIETCVSCDLRRVCGGTCRIFNQRFTGDIKKTYCGESGREKLYNKCVELATTLKRG